MSADPFDPFAISLSADTTVMDDLIQGKKLEGGQFVAVRSLTDHEREKNALAVPIAAGTRVAFAANIGSVLHYDYIPDEGVEGSVVMVRTAEGDCTSQGDNVFVRWDDGHFMPVSRYHLRSGTTEDTNPSTMRFASFGDLHGIFAADDKKSELVHKSTKDLWSFEEKDGEYVISRLFDDSGEPLKG